jgi:hypothetical protein
MMSMNQTQVTTNMLASFSEMLTTLIDQRLAILANRNETPLTEVIDRRINAARMQSDARRDEALGNLIDMKMKQAPVSIDAFSSKIIDTRIKTLMNDHLSDMIKEALDDALEEWMSDAANTDRLMKDIDIEELCMDAFLGKSLQITFER